MAEATSEDIENAYAMPPVGCNEMRVLIGEAVVTQFTVRCGSINCWFVGHSASRDDAQTLLNDHSCPTFPKNARLMTGRSTLQKMWDTLDEVTTAIIEKRDYNGMEGVELRGYVKGVALALSMMTHPFFKSVKEISKEAGVRYKIRKGLIEYRPTPGYKYNPVYFTANIVATEKMERTGPAKKRPASATTSPAPRPATRSTRAKSPALSEEQKAAIKAGAAMFSHEDLASMYGTSVDAIKSVLN